MNDISSQENRLFGPLSPELRLLVMRGTAVGYPRKALLFKEGELDDRVFILMSGLIKVYSLSDPGSEITYETLEPGALFGEISMQGDARLASAMALDDCICVVLEREQLMEHIAAEPSFAVCLWKQAITRSRKATQLVRELALEDVYCRLAATLEGGRNNPNHFPINAEGGMLATHKELASKIGASREMVSRLLKDLAHGGFVKITPGHIQVVRKLPSRW